MEVDEYVDGATFISEEKEEIVLALAVAAQPGKTRARKNNCCRSLR